MNYIGETIWLGEAGRFFTALAFSSALFSTLLYYKSLGKKEYLPWAKGFFYTHAFSVFSVIALLFTINAGHYFEYDYAWKHTSRSLEPRFLFSAFWEGQEGSFLLWSFWHAVLGLIFVFRSHKWEPQVVLVIALVQAFLMSMVLGIYPFDIKIGISPFVLIRELPENLGLPWTQMEDYLQKIPGFADGRGLNPLLQNYWMTIHPPTLFLGFASTIVPFAFAIGGLLSGQYKEWIKPALPWTYFSIGILGLGILMGGAWAYESLSFGGFWAWDPVENASLVPWLTLVGAAHLMMIAKNKKTGLNWAYGLVFITFFFIVYSTFLTRSGVLGDSSVHSFVDLGLNGQLLFFLLFFTFAPLILWLSKIKKYKEPHQDDYFWSREFWMFVGSLILLISGFQIIFSTSIPVINQLIGPDGVVSILKKEMAPPIDVIEHYNSFQAPFAIIITLLMAFGQFLSYRQRNANNFWKDAIKSILISLILTVIFAFSFKMWKQPIYVALVFTSAYALVSNLDYWLILLKGKLNVAGSSMAHAGFGLMMLGTVISQANQQVISRNKTYIADNIPANENILLEMGDTVEMNPYIITWSDNWQKEHRRYYQVDYFTKKSDGSLKPEFTITPHVQLNERMGLVAEPGTKHFLNKDIYTFLAYASDLNASSSPDGYGNEMEFSMTKGDTFIVERYFLTIDSILADTKYEPSTKDIKSIEITAQMQLMATDGSKYKLTPKYNLIENVVSHVDYESEETGIKIRFTDINLEDNKLVFKTWKKEESEEPFIIMKAIIFPMINLLWAGIILMTIGTFYAVYQRTKSGKKNQIESPEL